MKIALSVTLALLFIGCSQESSEPEKSLKQTSEVVKEAVKVEPKVKVVEEKSLEVSSVKKELPKETPQEIPTPVVQKIDGAKLFAKCASCHGQNAEKKALNKSQVIKGWSVADTIKALNGYKDGSYGSTMKGVMKPQVAKLTDSEVEALAEHISKL